MNVEQLFVDNGALLKGHFLLSSGLHSDRYLQCALVLAQPGAAEQLGKALVVTTGKSTKEVFEVVRASGANVMGALSIIDRTDGALDLKAPYTALWKVSIPAWRPEACPPCRAGIPVVKPGSRVMEKK